MAITISGSGSFTGATNEYTFDQSVGVAGTLTYEDVTDVDAVGVVTAAQGLNVGPKTGIACTISSVGNISGRSFNAFRTGQGYVYVSGSGVNGLSLYDTNNSTILSRLGWDGGARFTSSVGIGQDSPNARLHVQQNNADTDFTNETTPSEKSGVTIGNLEGGAGTFTAVTLSVSSGSGTQNANLIAQATGSGTAPDIHFATRNNSTTVSRMMISAAGNIGIGSTLPTQGRFTSATASGTSIAAVKTNTGASLSFGGSQQPRALIEADPSVSALKFYTAGGSTYGSAAWVENFRTLNTGITSITGNITVNGENYPTSGSLANRNKVINGAMLVAQRSTSQVASAGYQTVDRFSVGFGQGSIAQEQHALNSGDTGPYAKGFREAFRLTNTGTSNAATAYREIDYIIEAQDVATMGWDYTNTNSFVTLSFWVKGSVTQTYYQTLLTSDGTSYMRSHPLALTAGVWKYFEIAIPGNSNLQFDMNDGAGLRLRFIPFYGTGYTDNSIANDTWRVVGGGPYLPDMDDSWATTADSTLDITGVQLELGSKATPFEHKTYGRELMDCQRYFQEFTMSGLNGRGSSSTAAVFDIPCSTIMRGGSPDIDQLANLVIRRYDNDAATTGSAVGSIISKRGAYLTMNISGLGNVTDNYTCWLVCNLQVGAEL